MLEVEKPDTAMFMNERIEWKSSLASELRQNIIKTHNMNFEIQKNVA